MMRFSTKKLVLAAMFLALGLLLPFLTAQIPEIGSRLLPMHIPVLLCGFVCGWSYGLFVGLVTPLFRSMIFGMPPIFPQAVAMAFELAVYGLMTGLLYKILPKRGYSVVVSLLASMLAGRIVWGLVSYVLYGLAGNPFTWNIFAAGAFINAVPGIIIQLILIPPVVLALAKARLMEND